MSIYFRVVFIFLAFQFARKADAQDVGFSQFYAQPMLRNPALAGVFTGDLRFTASYRNQWQSVTVPYRTFALSSEVRVPSLAIEDFTPTIGLQLSRDVAGTSQFSTTQILPVITFSRQLTQSSYVSLGFMPGFVQKSFDPTKLILNDQFIPGSNGGFSLLPYSNQPFSNTSMGYFDLSLGATFSSSIDEKTDYYVGVGGFHVTSPKIGFVGNDTITVNKKFAFNAGLSTDIGDADELILYGDYFSEYTSQFKYAHINTFQAGLLYSYDISAFGQPKSITGGVLYRRQDAVIPVLQLSISDFVIGASYDVNISKLSVASKSRGGFELTLSYSSFLKSRDPLIRGVGCPKFGKHRMFLL